MSGVADHLVRRLREAGTRTLFGLPGGGGNLDIIEAAGRAGLPFVLTATETGSALAAMAQAEILGAPGACLTTIGPGAASVVNGVACASLDRAPLLVLTDTYASGGGAFAHQQIDHRALLGPVTKWSGRLAPGAAFQAIEDAFARLSEPPPGPVHLDCPADFQKNDIGSRFFGALKKNDSRCRFSSDLGRLLERSRKPLLIVGLGARRAEDAAAVRALCDARGVPAIVTYKGKGVVPDDHPWFAGVFTHAAIERAIVDQSDLLIGVGFDPVEVLPRPWTYPQPAVSIASWRMADDHVPFQAQQVGSIAGILVDAGDRLPRSEWDPTEVRAAVEAGKRAIDLPGTGMTAQDVVKAAARRFAGRARVTVDAGAHMFAVTMLWPVAEPNGLLISNGLSTMGFALPAAIGAALVDRDRPVVALTGDGGLLICLGELLTAVRERLKIVTIVFKDASLSLIEIKQQARNLAPKGVGLGSIDWVRIARGFGMPAWPAASDRELDEALGYAAASAGPCLIEATIDRSNYAATVRAIRG